MAKNDYSDLGFAPEPAPQAAANDHSDLGFVPEAPEKPGIPEAVGRGAMNGLTFSAEPAIAGGLDALRKMVLNGDVSLDDISKNYKSTRDSENQANKAAQDAHGVAYFGGNILGGLPLAIATGGGSEEATLANAIKTGAAFGAANGVGSGVSEGKDLGDIATGAIKDAGVGAVTGGALHGLIKGGKALLNTAADTSVINAPIKGFKQGLAGNDLITESGKDAAKNITQDVGSQLFNGVADEKENVGKKLGDLYSGMSGKNFNIQDIHDDLLNKIAEYRSTPGDAARDSAEKLQGIYDDIFKGVPKTLEGEVQPITLSRTIPGTQSSADKLAAQKAILEAQENLLPKGASSDIAESADDAGNPFLNLVKKMPGEEEGEESQVIKKTLPNDPGTPDQIIPTAPHGPVIDAKPVTIRTGGSDPQSVEFTKLRQLQKALTELGGVPKGSTPLPYSEAAAGARSLGQKIGDAIDSSNPDLGLEKDRYATLIQAMKNLGLKDEHFETDPLTGLETLTPGAENKATGLVARAARDGETQSGTNSANTLNDTIDKLAQVNYQKAGQLKADTQNAGELYDLMQKTQGLNFANKSTFLKSGGAYAGNLLGLGAKKVVDAGKGLVSDVANSGVAKLASAAIKPLENTSIAQGARSLLATGKPAAMKLASQLSDVMSKTGTQRNAAMFTLMQQPGYRELLKQHIPGLGDDQ